MKNIRHIIALLAVVLTFGTAQAESPNIQRSRQGNDPWQILQITLYNHHVDTTGLSVESPIDSVLLFEILPDLKKAYHVDKESAYLSHSTMLGEVICSFMRVKYAGWKGEIYDYYRLRYSPRQLFVYYLNKYPNSPYAEEMRLKMECIDQSRAWRRCESMDDYYEVYSVYDVSYCPYSGFSNIAKRNNALRENMALFVEYYLPSNYENHVLDDTMEDNNFDNINSDLVVPCSKIGHSVFFVGNSYKAISYTISFIGPSVLKVALDPRQHQWIELENGLYKVKVTTASGIEWWPYGKEQFIIEDGVYAGFWFDYFGMTATMMDSVELEDYDQKTTDVMYNIMIRRAIKELSSLMQLDYETQKILIMHYLQKIYSGKKDSDEINELSEKYTSEETINNLLKELQSFEEKLNWNIK